MKLRDYQLEAIQKMKTGCILNGGVGSGKSLTSLSYYYMQNGGSETFLTGGKHKKMKDPKDLYIITTARKRDTMEWEGELSHFLLSTNPDTSAYKNKVIVDSWNNIKKYKEVKGAFFIFDEQRVVGSGEWVKSFLKIAKTNEWILLSATPGDTWSDYIPVFIANGFYKNKSEFLREHAVFARYSKFPKIEKWMGAGKLNRYRRMILVDMKFQRKTVQHHEDVYVDYDIATYKDVMKSRWDIYKQEPIVNAGGLCYTLRRLVNSDPSRASKLLDIFKEHPKMIVFYNFDYELDILKNLDYGKNVTVAEWNCISTDTIVFYSQNYSYKIMHQSAGRIDRLNTPFEDLYYYHLKTRSSIDISIARAIKAKKNFNEKGFANF